ncbi:MAG: cytochrome c biogenesis protein CcsA [Planctomycetota bacterium]|nr:cytochrome c biogenesis protein CcsA [Planctomycetota bacterium]
MRAASTGLRTGLILAALLAAASLRAGDEAPQEPAVGPGAAKIVLKGDLDFSEIACLAVQQGGRKKPLHTLAAESVEQITGRPFFLATPYWKDKAHEQTVQALDVYLSIWLHTRDWSNEPVVLVAHGLLRRELGLPDDVKRFSFRTLADEKNSEAAGKLKALLASGKAKRDAKRPDDMTDLEKEAEIVHERLWLLGEILSDSTINCVPHPSSASGTWITPGTLVTIFAQQDQAVGLVAGQYMHGDQDKARRLVGEYLQGYKVEQVESVRAKIVAVLESYQRRDGPAFTGASAELRRTLMDLNPAAYPAKAAMEREVSYNQLRPFGKAWILYLLALVVGTLTFRSKSKEAYVAMMLPFLAGLAIHVYGFALRCLIAGRPPVSNMYESVIWVGFGTVFFALIFELIYRPKYFLLCGAAGGFICLVLMDLMPVVMGNSLLPGFEAHINPLVPVLRDNFWLTVHVLTITLSYAAFALAWVLAHVTLFKHLFQPQAKNEHYVLHNFIYRVIQIGVVLLATGTILGAVWAYYSWGRFWGWDPKETWAFITLLCYLVVLHGRFTGLWGSFGLCVGSVICFQAVVMAWYGVNFVLGNGLHAYASGAGGEIYVFTILALDAAFTGAAVYQRLNHRAAAEAEAAARAPETERADAGEKPSDSDGAQTAGAGQ